MHRLERGTTWEGSNAWLDSISNVMSRGSNLIFQKTEVFVADGTKENVSCRCDTLAFSSLLPFTSIFFLPFFSIFSLLLSGVLSISVWDDFVTSQLRARKTLINRYEVKNVLRLWGKTNKQKLAYHAISDLHNEKFILKNSLKN